MFGQRKPRTVFGTLLDRAGPEQTSEYVWTEMTQNILRNISGQQRSKTDFGTYVDNEDNEDKDQTSENMWTDKIKIRFRNVCGNRRPEQITEHM